MSYLKRFKIYGSGYEHGNTKHDEIQPAPKALDVHYAELESVKEWVWCY